MPRPRLIAGDSYRESFVVDARRQFVAQGAGDYDSHIAGFLRGALHQTYPST